MIEVKKLIDIKFQRLNDVSTIARIVFRERTMAAKKVKKEKNKNFWVHKVKTVSTFPPSGIFTKDARTIARVMASKKVSPKGIGSGIRMIQYFINRAGKGLTPTRKKELEEAKAILRQRLRSQK